MKLLGTKRFFSVSSTCVVFATLLLVLPFLSIVRVLPLELLPENILLSSAVVLALLGSLILRNVIHVSWLTPMLLFFLGGMYLISIVGEAAPSNQKLLLLY